MTDYLVQVEMRYGWLDYYLTNSWHKAVICATFLQEHDVPCRIVAPCQPKVLRSFPVEP